jgi:hypothetical protein
VCYNGDVFSAADMAALSAAFPELSAVMLGRGCAANPGLIRELALGEETDFQTFRAFHEKLLAAYRADYSGDKFVLQKMKELWYYMSSMFPGSEKQVKRICKSQRCCDYADAVSALFRDCPFDPAAGFHGQKKFRRFLISPANSGLFAGDRAAPACAHNLSAWERANFTLVGDKCFCSRTCRSKNDRILFRRSGGETLRGRAGKKIPPLFKRWNQRCRNYCFSNMSLPTPHRGQVKSVGQVIEFGARGYAGLAGSPVGLVVLVAAGCANVLHNLSS